MILREIGPTERGVFSAAKDCIEDVFHHRPQAHEDQGGKEEDEARAHGLTSLARDQAGPDLLGPVPAPDRGRRCSLVGPPLRVSFEREGPGRKDGVEKRISSTASHRSSPIPQNRLNKGAQDQRHSHQAEPSENKSAFSIPALALGSEFLFSVFFVPDFVFI